MTTPNPSDETADLVRSVAISSARLWEEVLERLARVEHAHAELAEAFSRLQNELPPPAMAPLPPGVPASLDPAPLPPGLDAAPGPHFVAPPPPPQGFGAVPPPPPPPGFLPASADAVIAGSDEIIAPPPPPPGFGDVGESVNGTDSPVWAEADIDPTTGDVPAWSEPPLATDAIVQPGRGAGEPGVEPPAPPPGFGVGSLDPLAPDAGLDDRPPPPPPGFQTELPIEPTPAFPPAFRADFPVEPPPPGFGSPEATDDVPPVPAGFSAKELAGFDAIAEATSPTAFADTLEPLGTDDPPLGPPPSAPPGFSVADLTGGDAIGMPPAAPLPPPGFSQPDQAGPAIEGPEQASDPFGDLLGDLDSAGASAESSLAAGPADGGNSAPPPPPGFATTGGSFADLPIVTPEPAPEQGAVSGTPPAPVPGREASTNGPRTEPPITPDFFARAGRRKR